MTRHHLAVAVLCVATGVGGCGDSFDKVSEIKSLRVLGIQKDPAYARPGGVVELRMLWADAPELSGRPIQRAWIGGCHNPPGDLFSGCIDQLAQRLDALAGGASNDATVATGDRFQLSIPEDIITSRPPPSDSNQPAYGISFVFFAVCAGQLGPAPDGEVGELPIACYDDSGALVSERDFMVGFSQVFSYEELENANPEVAAVRVAGRDVPVDCFGEGCLARYVPTSPIDCSSGDARCVAACADDGDADLCPEIAVVPTFAGGIGEVDPIGSGAEDETIYEQAWVNYYVDRGAVTSETRIVVDSETGERDDTGTSLLAPRAPGELTMWVTVHDSRGGTGWARLRLRVQ